MMSTTKIEIKHFNLLIDGQMVPSKQGGYFESINPSTGEVFARVANATVEDLQAAIKASRQALECGNWSNLSTKERGS
jgi:acyl-CoA reductase-like NAD-dependent aldehyde dehydrogenase